MKNTFRDLRPGDKCYHLIKDQIENVEINRLAKNSIEVFYKNPNETWNTTVNIEKNSWDKIYYKTFDGILCVSHETALMFQYKYYRKKIEDDFKEIIACMDSVKISLLKQRDILMQIVPMEDSIDWTDMIEKE